MRTVVLAPARRRQAAAPRTCLAGLERVWVHTASPTHRLVPTHLLRRSERLFLALGQEAELAAASARYLRILAPALPVMGTTEACKRWLMAQVRRRGGAASAAAPTICCCFGSA